MILRSFMCFQLAYHWPIRLEVYAAFYQGRNHWGGVGGSGPTQNLDGPSQLLRSLLVGGRVCCSICRLLHVSIPHPARKMYCLKLAVIRISQISHAVTSYIHWTASRRSVNEFIIQIQKTGRAATGSPARRPRLCGLGG